MSRIIDETANDDKLSTLKEAMRLGYITTEQRPVLAEFSGILQQLTVSEVGLVFKGEKIVLPQSLHQLAIEKAHQGSHPGVSSMKRRVRWHF